MPATQRPPGSPPRWLPFFLIFGLFLTLRGYHSRDGDQAYRLPLLLHRLDPGLYADDPFVRAFDAFNPHRGYLALLELAGRPLGLSLGMAGLFALTFALTCLGLDRLARAAWPEAGPRVGLVALVLVLIAKAGNIGTNHLFEAMLLDRLVAFALGWIALALAVEDPRRGSRTAPIALGLATLVHPSLGLQLAMLLGATWVFWGLCGKWTGVGNRLALAGIAALVVAVGPGLAWNVGPGETLFRGLPTEEFRLLSVELQGPQHMLPHLWRRPQWLAWGCYVVLGALALACSESCARRLRLGRAEGVEQEGAADRSIVPGSGARVRLGILLAVNLAAIGLAWVAVEGWQDLRVTLFQPFRLATVFRGLALAALSGRVFELWRRGVLAARARGLLLTVGLAGDWTLVVVTLVELTAELLERVGTGPRVRTACAGGVLASGLVFLARHDTESGHVPLLAALGLLALAAGFRFGRELTWNRRRVVWAILGAWAVPAASLLAAAGSDRPQSWALALVDRCRFTATPVDDVERLAVWCRDHTPGSARFIGPPGPKTFRLWSLRSLAFNRAASPYHAAGLADWSARFRDHVGFDGDAAAFVRAYLADRHGLERGYQAMSDADRAALAARQGASHVVAAAPPPHAKRRADGPLELLHIEGRYAVYRVRRPGEVALRGSPTRTR